VHVHGQTGQQGERMRVRKSPAGRMKLAGAQQILSAFPNSIFLLPRFLSKSWHLFRLLLPGAKRVPIVETI
jgi:hypothetical protein